MSMRGTKRAVGVRGEEPGVSKRRRTEQEEALWQLRPVSDLKMSSIYNRSASEAPAELFRKDLISAMKLPDSEPLTSSEYWVITDTWKQDWERGVQVPVNPDSLPAPTVLEIPNPLPPNFHEFKLPKSKYIHLSRDAHYQPEIHQLSTTVARAEAACTYDLDAVDAAWLKILNGERARAGAAAISEDQLEKVIEELELRCWDKIQAIMKSEEGLGIEYDENVICDVCRSPDSEEGNEMVFCDLCNICVHQACYGITTIPSGQWLCRPCGDGVRPTCVLCPNSGGAMKCTPSGHKWAHVSCVLWIPEVSIGCAEKMEPITKISAIPHSRWSLLCVLCKERKGACIQCSVKTCKTAYHVTCAFKHGLEMRAIIEDENADDGVKLRSYCQKHSVNSKKDKCAGSGSDEDEIKRKRRKDMTSEEKSVARAARLQEIEAEFDRHVSVKDISTHLLDVDQDGIHYIYNYWKLKRRGGHNRPLLPPKADDSDLLSHRQEQADLDKMKKFVQLRQDLERVRNLCYMVSRREKLSRSFFRMREQTFHKQVAVLSVDAGDLGSPGTPLLTAVIEANHGPSIYDRLYSHPNAPDHTNDFDVLLSRIAGLDSGDERKKDLNGLIKSSKSANPYKKVYVNGSSRRSGSIYSGLSSEESVPEIHRSTNYRNRTIGSSTEEDDKHVAKKVSPSCKNKFAKRTDKKKRNPPQRTAIESSSEDDLKSSIKSEKSRSRTLRAMEREMARDTGTDSDDLMPMKTSRTKFTHDIYSDSSEASSPTKLEGLTADKSPNATNDSSQPLPRTKAAMKEFIPVQKTDKKEPRGNKRGRKPSSSKDKSILDSDEEIKDKENIKHIKSKDYPTDLIVPQRQAAKKASENMRSNTSVKVKDSAEPSSDNKVSPSADESKMKPNTKTKSKDLKQKEISKKEEPIRKKSLPFDSQESEKDEKENPEIIAYVPQRQAAKKAAAHIKSGLGNKVVATEVPEDKKKDEKDKVDRSQKSPSKKEEEKRPKTPSKSSSSSSSNSSSSSCSTSSSSEEEAPAPKSRDAKPPSTRVPSLFTPPPTSRPTVDLPFLNKVSRPLSSTSASSDSIKGSVQESSSTSDVSPRKAPDKKLKTSERRSECRVPSPTSEGEEPRRSSDARPAARARTRITSTGGNMSNKRETGPRKPRKDDYNKTPAVKSKETSEPRELSPQKREANQALIDKPKEEKSRAEHLKVDETKTTDSKLHRRISDDRAPHEDKEKHKRSPQKSAELKNRRASVKEGLHVPDFTHKQKDYNYMNSTDLLNRASVSPTKAPTSTVPEKSTNENIPKINDIEDKWFSRKPRMSPLGQLPPVERHGDNEKYLTDEKALDLDACEKSSIKMMAKIQANLNENPLIKSPKTPMDARSNMIEPMDIESTPLGHKLRKHSVSTLENDKRYMMGVHDPSGYEMSKSAKIPTSINAYPNKSIFSPQPTIKDNSDLFEFGNDIMAVDDSVNDEFSSEEIMKPFSFSSEFLFKEDSKEDRGVQETLNLVEKLRMQLSSKKPVAVETHNSGSPQNEDKELHGLRNEVITKIRDEPDLQMTSLRSNTNDDKSLKNDVTAVTNHTSNIESVDLTQDTSSSTCLHPETNTENKWLGNNERITEADDSRKHDINTFDSNLAYNAGLMKQLASVLPPEHPSRQEHDPSKQSDDSRSLPGVDPSVNSNEPMMLEPTRNYDNNNSLMHSDCAAGSSPFTDAPSKWGESKITHRRSSASSTNSDGSVCSRKTTIKPLTNTHTTPHVTNMMSDMEYGNIPPYPCPMEPLPMSQYNPFPSETSSFVNAGATVSLFQPNACGPVQLPLQSPGAGLYPPILGAPFSSTSVIPTLPKPAYTPLCAAFTSSSQNIALTTAMIAPPTPKPSEQSPRDDMDLSTEKSYSMRASPTPSADSFNDASSGRNVISKLSNESNDTRESTIEVKSPAKQARTSTRFVGQQTSKSPGKSPAGISPKQADSFKSSTNKRSTNRSNRGQRGRGRSKQRVSQPIHGYPVGDYLGNSSIHSKLVGTVYELDLDEDIAIDAVDLKSMRERRRSIDYHERKSENSFKDSSQSPQISSPAHGATKRTASSNDAKEPQPQTPVPKSANASESTTPQSASDRPAFAPIVQPVLPGPVDMRRYQPIDTPGAAPGDTFHSHLLGAFASGTADQQLLEIDEEIEKQLHSELMASNSKRDSSSPVAASEIIAAIPQETNEIVPPYIPEEPLPKVSLSDSRNQLKVKIKGPFLDARYAASSVAPVVPQPIIPILEPSVAVLGNSSVVGNVASSMMSGTPSNLRRMRKKELLRQYCMNMDDPAAISGLGPVPPPVQPQPLTRNIITIPKAVASMTSIPTRDDYKDIPETNIQKKKRKTNALARELRHLDVTMNDDVDSSHDLKMSAMSSAIPSHKRRGRVNTKPIPTASLPLAPKLKIKIGNIVQPVVEEPLLQFRPPKKRCQQPLPTFKPVAAPKPSLEDMKRESMKFRRKVMADFDEGEKEKKHKPKGDKEKRKKKKDKKAEKLQIVNSESDKLIIKITRKKDEGGAKTGESSAASSSGAAAAAGSVATPPAAVDPFEYDPSAPDPLAIDPPTYSPSTSAMRKIRTSKVTPIRLKISRSSAGSGYVMKDEAGGEKGAAAAAAPRAPDLALAPPSAPAPLLPVTTHCEVR